jgi:hypothetical protein
VTREPDPDDWIFEDTPEFSEVTCDNGCPDGAQGRHKFSCSWAGKWFFRTQEAKILGVSKDQPTVCLEVNGEHFHADRHELLVTHQLSRVRYPDVEVHLSTGHSGNTMAILGTASGALRHAGYRAAADQLARDVFACESFQEALRLVQETVNVT